MGRSRPSSPSLGLIGALIALLLLLAIVGIGWMLWPDQPQRQHNDAALVDPETPKPKPREPLAPPVVKPRDDPRPQPQPAKPEPEPQRPPVALAHMTPFRGLVTEADKSLALRDEPEMDAERLWDCASTLQQLDSRFAPYAMLAYKGKADAADRRTFDTDATRSFENPDVGPEAYTIDAAPRAAIWLRTGAELPKAETEPPRDLSVPATRRLQEKVTPDVITGWMKAIETEFGQVDFGATGVPLDFVIFPDLAKYLRFSNKRLGLDVPKWSAGYYSSKWDVVCLPVLENTSLAEVIRHEMFHAVQAHKAPQSLLVPWFAEGTAEWLDKAPPNPNLRTEPVFAASAFGYLRTLIAQGLELDLKKFLAQDLDAFYQNPQLNYLIAYCFVDFVREQEDLRAVYFEFWKLMCDGVDKDAAFSRSFGDLDFADLQRRFLAGVQSHPRVTAPPSFSHDAPEQHFGKLPAELGSGVTKPAQPGGVSQGWFEVLGKLQQKGFDTARAAYLKGDFDRLVVAVDSSESMGWKIDTPGFDFDALSRWLFSLRYAGSISFTRKSADGTSEEEVPPAVMLTMVDAVLTDRADEFTATSGIKVGQKVQDSIKTSYADFDLTGAKLKGLTRRDIARHTAESIAWYWGTRQDRSDVVLVDFNTQVQVEKVKRGIKTSGYNTSASPLMQLFAKTAGNHTTVGHNGEDTDWWQGFENLVSNASGTSSGRVACIFITDGPNSAGYYGHSESGRDDSKYLSDQQKMAESLQFEWQNAGLDSDSRPSVLQLIAMPGAEGQGLDNIPQKIPQARLDEWKTHFVK